MPARRDKPPPQPDPCTVWEDAFEREFVRLRPHLEGAHRLLRTHLVAALAQHGLDSDPKAAAKAYHRATAAPKR